MLYKHLVYFVDKYEEEEEFVELLYFEALKRLVAPKNDLRKLDEALHVERVIKPFLIHWGAMTRVVGRKNLDWHLLTKTLKKLEPEFSNLRGLKFLDMDFSNSKISDPIEKIFENIRGIAYIGGPTGLSKIIHLMNTEVFVMWDEGIIEKYNHKYGQIDNTAEGYLRFLRMAKVGIEAGFRDYKNLTGRSLEDVRTDFQQQYPGKTVAKLIDEFNEYCPENWL